MQRWRRALVLTALIGLALGSAQVGLARGDEAFGRFVDAYFAAWFADRPSEGSAAGLHEYDTRLEDPSRPHVERRIVELKDQLGRLQAFDRARLAFDEAIPRLLWGLLWLSPLAGFALWAWSFPFATSVSGNDDYQ